MMEELILDSVSKYCEENNQEVLHPLISVVDFSKMPKYSGVFKVKTELYCIYLKETKNATIRYGKGFYDYQEGTLVFFEPGQEVEVEVIDENQIPKGLGLIFHPDFLHNTALGKIIKGYNYFGYHSNEALHISEEERRLLMACFEMIVKELKQNIDKHTKKLVCSYIELMLNYCDRFYDRQFITREKMNHGILEKLDEYLVRYFTSEKPLHFGVPSVADCAEKLNLSSNYFGDLVRKEIGRSPQDYIHTKLINIAKDKILESRQKSIAEISYEMGFKYPQHFTRLFKNKMGITPNEYRRVK